MISAACAPKLGSAVHGDDAAIRASFEKTYEQLTRRLQTLMSLPLDKLSPEEMS